MRQQCIASYLYLITLKLCSHQYDLGFLFEAVFCVKLGQDALCGGLCNGKMGVGRCYDEAGDGE